MTERARPVQPDRAAMAGRAYVQTGPGRTSFGADGNEDARSVA